MFKFIKRIFLRPFNYEAARQYNEVKLRAQQLEPEVEVRMISLTHTPEEIRKDKISWKEWVSERRYVDSVSERIRVKKKRLRIVA